MNVDKVDYKSPNITFCIENEDHTLGNALRSVLVERDDVIFTGYSVPHPMEPEMNIRIQTTGQPAVEVFLESIDDTIKICDILTEKFTEAVNQTITEDEIKDFDSNM